MATSREVTSLQREHSREELTSILESIRTQITDWQTSYGVETSGELRASFADLNDPNEIEERRRW